MTDDLNNMGSSQTVSNSGHFIDYEFLPAVVVETDDPLHYGRIKVSALGAYDANKSPASHLPWCYPFTMTGNASYASYEKGSKVWLFRNKKRQDENWFIPMYELHNDAQNFINNTSHSNKPEVISMRNNGGGKSSITYDHGGGYNISTSGSSGGSSVNVGTGGTTTISGGGSSVSAASDGITLGTPGENEHPAVLGDNLKKIIESFFGIFQLFANTLMKDDTLASNACLMLNNAILSLQDSDCYKELLSETVKICETTPSEKAAAEKAAAEKKQAEESKKFFAGVDEAKDLMKKEMSGEQLTAEEKKKLDSFSKDQKSQAATQAALEYTHEQTEKERSAAEKDRQARYNQAKAVADLGGVNTADKYIAGTPREDGKPTIYNNPYYDSSLDDQNSNSNWARTAAINYVNSQDINDPMGLKKKFPTVNNNN